MKNAVVDFQNKNGLTGDGFSITSHSLTLLTLIKVLQVVLVTFLLDYCHILLAKYLRCHKGID
jgi:hypothetical protein